MWLEDLILRLPTFVGIWCTCIVVVKLFLVGKMHWYELWWKLGGLGKVGWEVLITYQSTQGTYLNTYIGSLPMYLHKLFPHLFKLTTYALAHPHRWPTYIPIHLLSVHIRLFKEHFPYIMNIHLFKHLFLYLLFSLSISILDR
jgi:hypothetical protein